MKLFQSLNKNLLIVSLLASTGIPVSLASAQFEVEYSAKAQTTPEVEKTEVKVMIFKSNDGEHEFEVKIVNGKIEFAKIDGQEVDDDQIQFKGRIVIFSGEDGEVIHEIKVPKTHDKTDNAHVTHARRFVQGNRFFNTRKGEYEVNVSLTPEDGTIKKFITSGQMNTPKVMLGINLGEPSTILRKHLQLKGDAILVEKVIDGLPAKISGIQDFDIIISIDGSDEANGEILGKVLAEKDAGDTMKLVVLRAGEKIKVLVKLAEYDAEALGTTVVTSNSFPRLNAPSFPEVDMDMVGMLLVELEESGLGPIEESKVREIREMLVKRLSQAEGQKNNIAIQLQDKAMDAMHQAERQMVELRNGKLFVGSRGLLPDHFNRLSGQIPGRMHTLDSDTLTDHLDELEDRLSVIEDNIENQLDTMSDQIERLADMFERLMGALEEND